MEAGVASVEDHEPDVVLLDVSLPVLRGFDAARGFLAKQPKIELLFVPNYAKRAYVEKAFRMGAGGYVLRAGLLPSCRTRSERHSVVSSIRLPFESFENRVPLENVGHVFLRRCFFRVAQIGIYATGSCGIANAPRSALFPDMVTGNSNSGIVCDGPAFTNVLWNQLVLLCYKKTILL